MKLETMILGLLSWRPFSGYDLGKYLRENGQFFRSNIQLSQIYRTLARMTEAGSVDFTLEVNDGRPDSKVYRLTEAGKRELREWVTSPYEPPSRWQDPEFMVRFLIGGPLDREALIRLVQTELDARRARIPVNRGRNLGLDHLDPIDEVNLDAVHRLISMAQHRGRKAVDEWIAWLETILEELSDGTPAVEHP
ncbi:helix-turn-helix transcriptional regulator [Prescottella defluvii]|uniref:helix-turn-helix transcriptional regulator n=1 Tax=Prescottella defluvii TaxID=1323361 RepID=UPI0006907EEF|nr:helix-turn-helix transcriptional regulator [Prescottella defluvii]